MNPTKAKGSQLKPKVRCGIAWGMYREQVVFKCTFTSSTFRSKSFTAIELEEGLSCYQFWGMPQPTLSKRRLARKQPELAKVDIRLRKPTESRRLPLIPVVTLQSANAYGVVEERLKCTGKRTRPGTPSSPDLGGSVRLFDEDGNQLETDRKTGELKGTVLQMVSLIAIPVQFYSLQMVSSIATVQTLTLTLESCMTCIA